MTNFKNVNGILIDTTPLIETIEPLLKTINEFYYVRDEPLVRMALNLSSLRLSNKNSDYPFDHDEVIQFITKHCIPKIKVNIETVIKVTETIVSKTTEFLIGLLEAGLIINEPIIAYLIDYNVYILIKEIDHDEFISKLFNTSV